MCGIVGFAGEIIGWDPRRLDAMRDALKHRGPDTLGTRIFDLSGEAWNGEKPAYAGLAHRRLSILDLSDAGSQPMANEDGSVWITYNGEFYNYNDYRTALESRGHRFRSHCDTETILHLYEEYGILETLRRINGMFAFGLWDQRRRMLILARDRFGKKPLYYMHVQKGIFFASEMKALLASGLVDRTRLDEEALVEALHYGTPFRERTVFAQIRMLPPSCYAIWRDGAFEISSYYQHPFETVEPDSCPIDKRIDELEALLADAIRLRLVSDVPVGLFLSGGIDSSTLAVISAKVLKNPLQAYCVAFSEQEYDESRYARALAKHLDLPFQSLESSGANPDLDERIAGHIDQPLGDSSLVPTYLVSKSARESGVKVVITGDGGDEVFAGYETYRRAYRLWGAYPWGPLPPLQRSLNDTLWETKLRLIGPERGYFMLQQQFARKHLRRISKYPARVMDLARSAENRRREVFRKVAHRPILDRFQYSDMQTMMVDDVLRKVDLMSMAHGLECRCPFLDYRVVEFAARLQVPEKVDGDGRSKILLRRLLARYIPISLIERPKMGFCMPWSERCTGQYANQLVERWRNVSMPHLRSDAGCWIFHETGVGSQFRKWNAYTHMVFFERLSHLT